MRKFLFGMFITINIVGFIVLSMPGQVSAQSCGSADSCERAAQTCSDNGGTWNSGTGVCSGGNACSTSFLGLPTWYKYLELDGSCEVTGPTDSVTGDLLWPKVVGYIGVAVLEVLLRLAALVSIGFVMYGGFRYITSQGEPDSTKSARQTIQNALIGLVISLIATAIVAFIANELTN